MSLYSRILKNTSWMIISRLTLRISNSLIAIMIPRMLGVNANGSYNTAISYYYIGLSLAVWGFDQFFIREISQDPKKVNQYLGNLIIIQSILSLITIILFTLFSWFLPYIDETVLLIRVFSIQIFSESILTLCQAIFISFENVKKISIVNSCSSILKLLTVLIALQMNMTLEVIVWIIVTTSLGTMIIYLYLSRNYIPKNIFKVDWKLSKYILKSSFPIFIISILFTLLSRIDVLLLSFISNNYTVGLFTAAINLVSFLFLFPEGFRDVIYPTISRLHRTEQKKTQELYSNSIKYLLIITLPVALIISFYSQEIVNFIYPSGFDQTHILLRILIWFFPIYSILIFNSRLLIIDHKPKIIIKNLVYCIIILVIGDIVLYPNYGVFITGITRVVAMLFLTFNVVKYVSKNLYKNLFVKHNLKTLLGLIIMGFVIYIIKLNNPVIAIIVGIISYSGVLILLQVFSQSDISYWKNIAKK